MFTKKRLVSSILLAFICFLAFVFRFCGIKYGIPVPGRDYSIHPDEFLTVETAFEKVVRNFSLDIGFYNYPSLYIYISGFFMIFGIVAGGNELGDLYLYARAAAALLGALSVPVVFYAGSKLFNVKAGTVAALVLAVAPLHFIHSHFAAVDVPSTLFIAATLMVCGYIVKKADYKYVILAGIFAGLAAGTKYNAVLVFLSVIAAVCLSPVSRAVKARNIVIGSLCVLLAFFITTPGAIINFDGFRSALLYERAHTSHGHSNVFVGLGSPFVFNLAFNLFTGFGAVATFVALVGMVCGIVRKNKSIAVISAFVVPYYILMSISRVNFSRYMLPIYPALALYAGYAVYLLLSQKKTDKFKILFTGALLLLFGAGIILPAKNAVAVFHKTPPQDRCTDHIASFAPESLIGVIDYPWFYSPAYSGRSGYGTLDLRKKEFDNDPRLVLLDKDVLPDYVIVSDYEFYDEIRIMFPDSVSSAYKSFLSGKRLEYTGKNAVLEKLNIISSNYRLEKRFDAGSAVTLLNCPHDMCYINPQIYVFKKKNGH